MREGAGRITGTRCALQALVLVAGIDPHLFGFIDFRPFRQPHLAGTGCGKHLKLKAADRRRICPGTFDRVNGPGDLVMRNRFKGFLECRRFG